MASRSGKRPSSRSSTCSSSPKTSTSPRSTSWALRRKRFRCWPRRPSPIRKRLGIRAMSTRTITRKSMLARSKPGVTARRPGRWPTRAASAMWKNTLPRYEILSEDQVQQIHDHAMLILQEIGVDFLHPRAIDTFRAAGLKIEENRVRFERAFVEEQVAKVPPMFEVQARNAKNTVTIGGDFMVNAPVYGPPFITDLDRGRRGATIDDFTNFDKMAQATPQIHCAGGTIVEPEALPLGPRHLAMVYTHILC